MPRKPPLPAVIEPEILAASATFDLDSWVSTASREELVQRIRDLSERRPTIIEVHNDLEAVSAWLNTYQTRSLHTQRAFRLESERFLIWLSWVKGFSLAHLPNVTVSDVTEYYAYLGKRKKPIPQSVLKVFNRETQPFADEGLDDASRLRARNALSRMLDVLRNFRGPHGPYIQFNPWATIRDNTAKNVSQDDMDVLERGLSKDEWQIIKGVVEALPQGTRREQAHYRRARWILALFFYSFIRRNEAAALKMSNFTPRRNGWWLLVEEGKGGKTRRIVAPQKLITEMVAYRQFYGLPDYPSPSEDTIPAILPVAWNGKRQSHLTSQAIYLVFKELCKRAKEAAQDIDPFMAKRIGQASPHWTRHTGISHAMDTGMDPRSVQKQAGHSSLDITARYDHKPQDDWANDMEKL